MRERFQRTEMLLGSEGMERLANARVAVFGLGGVGGFAAEALARSGVGALDLIDYDTVSESNCNRQLLALESTVGAYKVDVAAERIGQINPDCKVRAYKLFYLPETEQYLDLGDYDYIIDAIDTVTGKLLLIGNAKEAGVPIISAMGTGNKLDPAAFRVADITETSVCPLARIMRKELKKRGIEHLKVVYSEEKPLVPEHREQQETSTAKAETLEEKLAAMDVQRSVFTCDGTACGSCGGCEGSHKKDIPGSVSFVPGVAGMILAGVVIRELCGISINA